MVQAALSAGTAARATKIAARPSRTPARRASCRAAPVRAPGLPPASTEFRGRTDTQGRRRSSVNGKLPFFTAGCACSRPGEWPLAKKRARRRPSAS